MTVSAVIRRGQTETGQALWQSSELEQKEEDSWTGDEAEFQLRRFTCSDQWLGGHSERAWSWRKERCRGSDGMKVVEVRQSDLTADCCSLWLRKHLIPWDVWDCGLLLYLVSNVSSLSVPMWKVIKEWLKVSSFLGRIFGPWRAGRELTGGLCLLLSYIYSLFDFPQFTFSGC